MVNQILSLMHFANKLQNVDQTVTKKFVLAQNVMGKAFCQQKLIISGFKNNEKVN